MSYRIIQHTVFMSEDVISAIVCSETGFTIPMSPANRHYQEVLDAIIEQGASCFEGDIPADLQAAADEKQFNQQLADYRVATARLAQYVVADGRAEVREMQNSHIQLTDSDGMAQYDSDGSPIYEQVEVITVTAINPLPATVFESQFDSDGNRIEVEVPNPAIVSDEAERAAAQNIINNTEQAVIDHYEANQ